jgi:hypothetical protein
LVYLEDGRRVLTATYPLMALMIAGGFFAPNGLRIYQTKLRCRAFAVSIPAVLIITLMLPFFFRLFGIAAVPNIASGIATDEHIIAGNTLRTGFVVLPDSEPLLTDTPSMSLGKFHAFLDAAGLTPTVTGRALPSAPFAFIYAFDWSAKPPLDFFLPSNVLRDKTVERWKIKVAPIAGPVQWAIGSDAEPVK